MKQETASFKAFQDDLQKLLPFFDLDSTHKSLRNFIELFDRILSSEAEFSFAPHKRELEITVGGKGKDFHEKIETLMRAFSIPPEYSESYRAINEFFPETGTLIKSDFRHRGNSSISLYYQTHMPVKLASRISHILKIERFPSEAVFKTGSLLGRKGVYVGIDFSSDSPPALSIFYPLPPKKAKMAEKFIAVMEGLTMSQDQTEFLKKYHGMLTEFVSGDLFVSFALQENSLNRLKIDYELISLPLAIKILKDRAVDEEEILRFLKITQAIETSMLSYLGIKYLENGDISFKFYYKRVYFSSESEEMEKIANFLEASIWRFGE